MKEKDYLALVGKRERYSPTAIRILVLQAMLKAGRLRLFTRFGKYAGYD